jgi:exocyst complex component 2
MTQDIINLYVSLLSSFFSLSSSSSSNSTTSPSMNAPTDLSSTPPMPPFVPPISNATTNGHYVLKILNEVQDCVNELGALELTGEATQSLRELISAIKWRFEEVICSGWVRDAKIFYRLENWKPDSDHDGQTSSTFSSSTTSGRNTTTTSSSSSTTPTLLPPPTSASTNYLRKITAFHRFNVISAYRVAGGSEERAQSLLGNGNGGNLSNVNNNNPLSNNRTTTTTGGGGRNDLDSFLTTDYQRKIQGAFLDGLYAFLDGLVHVAFSDPQEVSSFGVNAGGSKESILLGGHVLEGGAGSNVTGGGDEDTGRPKEVDLKNVVSPPPFSLYTLSLSFSPSSRFHYRRVDTAFK